MMNHELLVQITHPFFQPLLERRPPVPEDLFLEASEWVEELAIQSSAEAHLLLLNLLHVREGHLCLPIQRIVEFALESGLSPAEAAACLQAVDEARFIRPSGTLLIRTEKTLRFERMHQAECRLSEVLQAALERPPVMSEDEALGLAQQVLHEMGRQLHADQMRALVNALRYELFVLSGGPGTGKTTVMASLLMGLQATGLQPSQMALAAPTGRAAQRMTDTLREQLPDSEFSELKALTLHRLLGFHPRNGSCRFHAGAPLPYRVLIVDEVSMVDALMMQRVLDALDPNATRLILIGDRNQLPSVDAGAVLASILAPQGAEVLGQRRVFLTHVFRSEANVLNAAQAVLLGRMPDLRTTQPQPDFWSERDQALHWEPDQREKAFEDYFRALYPRWIRQSLRSSDLQDEHILKILIHFRSARILTLVREGDAGVNGVNESLRRIVCHALEIPRGALSYAGMPIMVERNHYELGLFNGDMGVLVWQNGTLTACFEREGRVQHYPYLELPDSRPCYAMTVHKSQGSEFGRVLMVLPQSSHRMLSKELVYTGLTRARYSVAVLGEKAVLQLAVGRRARDQSVSEVWDRINVPPCESPPW